MTRLEEFKRHLRPGHVYRREELAQWSNAVDRHLKQLVDDGTLTKLAPGLYAYPKETAFGIAPAEDDKLVETFLRDRRFLLASPNAYNMLGVGTTQLYDKTVVYNHKRHGSFSLGGRAFDFRVRPSFPRSLNREFLLVDLVNNVDRLAESKAEVLARVRERAASYDASRLLRAARDYGNVRTKKFFTQALSANMAPRVHRRGRVRSSHTDGTNMAGRDRIRIRLEHLEKAFSELDADPVLHGQDKSFALGCGIVRRFLDEQWIDRHFAPTGKKGALTLDESSPESRERSAFRLIDLSEVLYNLQDVPGFDECIRKMSDGDIEGTYAELDFGRMLYLNKVPFRFVVPQGVKRLDYDIEIVYPNGMVVCADAKCKIEATEFSENGVRNVLADARKQLPKELPSIVFVKVPPRWIEQEAIVASTIRVARRFLGGVRRIVSVKFYSSPLVLQDGVMRHQHAYKEVSNPKTEFGDGVNWDIFRKFQLPPEMNGMPPHWQRILFFPEGKPKWPPSAKTTAF